VFWRPKRDRFGGRRRTPPPGSGLHVCTACHEDWVHPVEWREADDAHWWMRLRCGGCSEEREVTVPDDVAQRFGKDLDAAEAAINRELMRLDCERMAGEVEAFVGALERDLIDAGDFARRAHP
jgi:hypothetical protein